MYDGKPVNESYNPETIDQGRRDFLTFVVGIFKVGAVGGLGALVEACVKQPKKPETRTPTDPRENMVGNGTNWAWGRPEPPIGSSDHSQGWSYGK